MGYRSDGRWAIKGPVDTVTAAWAELRLNPPEYRADPDILGGASTLADFDCYTIGDTGYIRFEFNSGRWYTGCPAVQWYEQVWARLAETEGLSGKRVHIGEDNAVDETEFGDDTVNLYAVCHFEDDEPTKDTQ